MGLVLVVVVEGKEEECLDVVSMGFVCEEAMVKMVGFENGVILMLHPIGVGCFGCFDCFG